MAASTPTPHADIDRTPDPIPDPVTFKEAAAMLRLTKRLVSAQTLQRWAVQDGVRIEPGPGRAHVASYSELLEVHARRFPPPAPGRP